MKAFFLLFFTAILSAQTITYTPDNTNFPDPERGMYYHTETDSGSYDLLTQSELTNKRISESITLVLRVFYLQSFRNSPISAAYLNNIQTDLTTARQARVKLIIRFAYNDGGFSGDDDAPKTIILNHITQLSPVLNANKDVIHCIQMGFVGRWGEGYYSTYFGSNGVLTASNIADRNEILSAVLSSFPRQIQVRTPLFKQRLVGTVANTNTQIGHHNDSFLSSNSEQGTYNNVASERLYVQQESDYVPVGGECNAYPTAYTNCTNALTDLSKYSWNYLNSVGYASGIINYWQTNGCLDEIKKRLGYRFELVSSTLSGNTLNIKINNVGFGHIINPRPVKLVLKNTTTNVETFVDVSTDCRLWLKSQQIDLNAVIPLTGLSNGQYKIYIFLPDEFNNIPEYAIRFANVGVWDAAKGYNDLGQTLSVNGICVNSTTWNGSTWSNGAPNVTTTAIINGTYNNNISFDCCDLVVNAPLQINNNRFVTFQNDISGSGTVTVKSGGKLIPVNDFSTCNNSNITVERTTSTLNQYDYVYFSSPTKNTVIESTLGNWFTERTFHFDGQFFIDLETNYQGNFISNTPDGQDDSDPSPWIPASFGSVFTSALGYPSMIVNGTFPRTESVSFKGCINTGIIQTPLIISGNPTALLYNPNIVGNPYSSSILADSFIIDNLPNISGTIYFWTHTNGLSSSYSGLEQFNFIKGNYSSYNLSGGIASSFGGLVPNGFIPSCQGFLVYAENNASLVFKPSYMAAGYPNAGNFYRSSPYTRYHLNLYDSDSLYKQILINYNSDTTLDYDKGWDSKTHIYNEPLKFYTLGDYEIEARGDFEVDDAISLGMSTLVETDFTLSLSDLETIETVYLFDTYLGIWHNLEMPYTFHSEVGVFNDRFKIYYSPNLSTNTYKNEKLIVFPNPTKNKCTIFLHNPKQCSIFAKDISGRLVDLKKEVLADRIIFDLADVSIGTYFINVNEKTVKIIKE